MCDKHIYIVYQQLAAPINKTHKWYESDWKMRVGNSPAETSISGVIYRLAFIRLYFTVWFSTRSANVIENGEWNPYWIIWIGDQWPGLAGSNGVAKSWRERLADHFVTLLHIRRQFFFLPVHKTRLLVDRTCHVFIHYEHTLDECDFVQHCTALIPSWDRRGHPKNLKLHHAVCFTIAPRVLSNSMLRRRLNVQRVPVHPASASDPTSVQFSAYESDQRQGSTTRLHLWLFIELVLSE